MLAYQCGMAARIRRRVSFANPGEQSSDQQHLIKKTGSWHEGDTRESIYLHWIDEKKTGYHEKDGFGGYDAFGDSMLERLQLRMTFSDTSASDSVHKLKTSRSHEAGSKCENTMETAAEHEKLALEAAMQARAIKRSVRERKMQVLMKVAVPVSGDATSNLEDPPDSNKTTADHRVLESAYFPGLSLSWINDFLHI